MTQTFLVLNASGVPVNRIIAEAGFAPGPGLTLAPDDGRTVQQQVLIEVPADAQAWQLKWVLGTIPSKLGHAGTVLDDANAAASAAGGLTKVAWDNAPTIQRNSPTLNAMAASLGLSSADVDAAFLAAPQVIL